jgi:hypothetical protein
LKARRGNIPGATIASSLKNISSRFHRGAAAPAGAAAFPLALARENGRRPPAPVGDDRHGDAQFRADLFLIGRFSATIARLETNPAAAQAVICWGVSLRDQRSGVRG